MSHVAKGYRVSSFIQLVYDIKVNTRTRNANLERTRGSETLRHSVRLCNHTRRVPFDILHLARHAMYDVGEVQGQGQRTLYSGQLCKSTSTSECICGWTRSTTVALVLGRTTVLSTRYMIVALLPSQPRRARPGQRAREDASEPRGAARRPTRESSTKKGARGRGGRTERLTNAGGLPT
jgi:hypothetical protein